MLRVHSLRRLIRGQSAGRWGYQSTIVSLSNNFNDSDKKEKFIRSTEILSLLFFFGFSCKAFFQARFFLHLDTSADQLCSRRNTRKSDESTRSYIHLEDFFSFYLTISESIPSTNRFEIHNRSLARTLFTPLGKDL